MNEYDDINNFLNAQANINLSYQFLMNYINTFLYKNPNREKIEDFYKKIPSIIDKLFGLSSKTGKSKQLTAKINDIDLLNSENTTFYDFDALLHLLEPGLEFTSMKHSNLFFSINNPPEYIPHYYLPASILSKSISSLLQARKIDYVLSLCYFNSLSKNLEFQRKELEKGQIHTNLFEYYITLLLVVIKDYPTSIQHKIILNKVNKNFQDIRTQVKNILKKSKSEKSKDNFFSLDFNRSLIFNFFNILFKNILDYLSKRSHINDLFKLKLIVSGVETIWLSEFFLPVAGYNPSSQSDIYSYFFKKSSLTESFGGAYTPVSIEKVLSQNLQPLTIPNLIVLQCLTNIISSLQENYLFSVNKGTASLERDSMIYFLHKPLFYFLKNCFINISEGSANSEANLGDIARIWYTYITPWNKLKDGTNLVEYQDAIREYIFSNILFYTEIYNDYIIAFNSVNVLNKNEINLMNDILSMYDVNDKNEIILGYLNLEYLEELSLGKVFVKIINLIFLSYKIF
jgi:hypothetical protein